MTCSKDQKVTTMVLKVDLDCCQCYRKVKKVLCKFPQIRNQMFDEKNNTVTITVVCCSPEKIRDKLCCKAGKSIKSIEIKPPPKPTPPPDEKPKPAPDQKPPPMQKNGSKNGSKKSDPAPEAAPKAAPKAASPAEQAPKPAPAAPAPAPAPKQPEPQAQWVPGYPPAGPPPQAFPVAMCCTPCYEGRPGGPCYGPGPGYPYGYYGRPCPPQPYCASRCDYFSEENPSACSIM
uniref:Uncharacterized protein n=1 Tax=Chenopodium quinoa TaxID=63459 RepID=A0A803M1I8_CHEQI